MTEETSFHGYVAVQARGVLALPAALRRRYRLDEPGAQVEITERADGVWELRPTLAVPATQAWFWTEDWQLREREVDDLVAAGHTTTYPGPDELLAGLDTLDAGDEPPARAKRRRR